MSMQQWITSEANTQCSTRYKTSYTTENKVPNAYGIYHSKRKIPIKLSVLESIEIAKRNINEEKIKEFPRIGSINHAKVILYSIMNPNEVLQALNEVRNRDPLRIARQSLSVRITENSEFLEEIHKNKQLSSKSISRDEEYISRHQSSFIEQIRKYHKENDDLCISREFVTDILNTSADLFSTNPNHVVRPLEKRYTYNSKDLSNKYSKELIRRSIAPVYSTHRQRWFDRKTIATFGNWNNKESTVVSLNRRLKAPKVWQRVLAALGSGNYILTEWPSITKLMAAYWKVSRSTLIRVNVLKAFFCSPTASRWLDPQFLALCLGDFSVRNTILSDIKLSYAFIDAICSLSDTKCEVIDTLISMLEPNAIEVNGDNRRVALSKIIGLPPKQNTEKVKDIIYSGKPSKVLYWELLQENRKNPNNILESITKSINEGQAMIGIPGITQAKNYNERILGSIQELCWSHILPPATEEKLDIAEV